MPARAHGNLRSIPTRFTTARIPQSSNPALSTILPAMIPARIALVLLLSSGPLFAKAPATYHYLPPASVSLSSLLPNPPAPGSPENQADIQADLARQQARTPAEITRAQSEEELTPAAFSNLFGPWFTPEKLPLTFALLNNASDDAHSIAASAKHLWQRPPPPLQDPALHPIVTLPKTFSYPSFHATRGALWAAILAQLAPDLRDPILARGAQIGEDRIIAGVHFPTDVAAGQRLGRYLAQRLLKNPAFQHDLALARAEFSATRPKSAATFSKNGRIFYDSYVLDSVAGPTLPPLS